MVPYEDAKNFWITGLTGIESGSPKIIERHMQGKVRPFKTKEWPDVVEQAFGICDDNNWVPVGMFIIGLPGEEEDDVTKTTTLVDRLKPHKSIIVPFIFTAKGKLNDVEGFNVEGMKVCHLDLVEAILGHNAYWGKQLMEEHASRVPIMRWQIPLLKPLINRFIDRVCEKLREETIRSISMGKEEKPEHVSYQTCALT